MSHLDRRGYASLTCRDTGKVLNEYDTFTCAHGNEIVKVLPGMVSQAPFCVKCMKPICLKCHGEAQIHGCVPIEERLLAMERRRPIVLA